MKTPITNKNYLINTNIELNHFLHLELQYRLIIECVNNLQPVVFFTRPDKNPYTIFGKFKYSKLERQLEDETSGPGPDFEFHEFTTSSKDFHYNNFDTNSQYCSFQEKKGKEKEWMASHPDGLHDTFNKLFDFTSYQETKYKEWMPKSAWWDDVFVVMLFPILVLQNELFEVVENGVDIEVQPKQHIVFEFNRHTNYPEKLLIDVVTEDYFPEFLELLRNDIEKLKVAYITYYSDNRIQPTKRGTEAAPKAEL